MLLSILDPPPWCLWDFPIWDCQVSLVCAISHADVRDRDVDLKPDAIDVTTGTKLIKRFDSSLAWTVRV